MIKEKDLQFYEHIKFLLSLFLNIKTFKKVWLINQPKSFTIN